MSIRIGFYLDQGFKPPSFGALIQNTTPNLDVVGDYVGVICPVD
jgi:hypothetical protein